MSADWLRRLHLEYWFGTNSVRCQINRKKVIRIQIWLNLTRFPIEFSLCAMRVTLSPIIVIINTALDCYQSSKLYTLKGWALFLMVWWHAMSALSLSPHPSFPPHPSLPTPSRKSFPQASKEALILISVAAFSIFDPKMMN